MPWATLLPLLALLPPVLSAAIRYSFGTSFEVALAYASAPFVILAGVVYVHGLPRCERAANPALGPLMFALTAVAVVFTFELWWTPLFEGLPNTFEGVDIGNHLLLYQRFIRPGQHEQYEGFVGMYGLMHWYRELLASTEPAPRSYYQALRFAHYAFLLSLPVALSLMLYPVLARLRSTVALLIALVLSLPVPLAALAFLLFPALQYFQAEGFYSQIAGLYPLLFGYLCYGLIENAALRFLLCCAWLLVQRFTYGLNLSDNLLALAYLWLWDARSIRFRPLRWGAWAFVPVAASAAVLILGRLWPLRHARGYFIDYAMPWLVGGMLLTAVLLVFAADALRQRGIHVSAASERLWRYAAVHGLVTGTLMAIYLASDAPRLYYIQKFALYATVLLGLAVVGPVCTVIAHVVEHGPRWLLARDHARLLWGMLALGALALFGSLQGYVVYRPQARERWRRSVPSTTLYSNYEPAVQAFIEQTLHEKGQLFAGYYDTFWPRMFTHNTLFFLFEHQRDHFFNFDFLEGRALFYEGPGCYFVLGTPAEYLPGPNSSMVQQIRRFYDARQKCTTFRPRWAERQHTVCATCF
ncbi:MAG TPA: hypothetical protein VI299_10980 [Polyangiales bacterium]